MKKKISQTVICFVLWLAAFAVTALLSLIAAFFIHLFSGEPVTDFFDIQPEIMLFIHLLSTAGASVAAVKITDKKMPFPLFSLAANGFFTVMTVISFSNGLFSGLTVPNEGIEALLGLFAGIAGAVIVVVVFIAAAIVTLLLFAVSTLSSGISHKIFHKSDSMTEQTQ